MTSSKTSAMRCGVAGLVVLWGLSGPPVGAWPEGSAADDAPRENARVFYQQGVPRVGQEQSLWCWAAAVEMIGDFLNRPIDQCTQVQRWWLPQADCCDPKSWSAEARSSCVKGGWPSLRDLPGFTSTRDDCHDLWKGTDSWFEKRENCYLSWGSLKQTLERAPVAFSWRFADNGGQSGHMMVATGYLELPDGSRWVLVHDPWPPGSGDVMLITFERYAIGDYQHWRDYYKKAPGED